MERPPKALIVPHAGYVYSGPVAARAYAELRGRGGSIDRVVLLGPAHHVEVHGVATIRATEFLTPLGSVPVDGDGVHRALGVSGVVADESAHLHEHALEVQLPLLQRLIDPFRIVPLLAGDVRTEPVADLLEALWDGPSTLLVISSDLSHYHDYTTARSMDLQTARAIEALAWERLDESSACGRGPICGLLEAARRRGLTARRLDLRSSGDTAGSRREVVGYGAWAFA